MIFNTINRYDCLVGSVKSKSIDEDEWYKVEQDECKFEDGSQISPVEIESIDEDEWYKVGQDEYEHTQDVSQKELDSYRLSCGEEYIKETIKNGTFIAGGDHKKIENTILRADDKASQDFLVENRVGFLLSNHPSLEKYISIQERINVSEDIAKGFHYAQVPMYNKEYVSMAELDTLISFQGRSNQLTHEQVRDLALQLIDMLKEFYLVGLVHRDLHMHNLMVYSIKPESGSSSRRLILKAIDFGKSKIFPPAERKNNLDDLRYIFKQEACGFLETLFRKLRGSNHKKQQKHYPLHRLLSLVGVENTNQFLKEVGNQLINGLTIHDMSERGQLEIRKAFDVAKSQIENALNGV